MRSAGLARAECLLAERPDRAKPRPLAGSLGLRVGDCAPGNLFSRMLWRELGTSKLLPIFSSIQPRVGMGSAGFPGVEERMPPILS